MRESNETKTPTGESSGGQRTFFSRITRRIGEAVAPTGCFSHTHSLRFLCCLGVQILLFSRALGEEAFLKMYQVGAHVFFRIEQKEAKVAKY
jgi:hypothetical protein